MVFLQDSWALMPPTFRWCGDLVPSGTAPAISSYSARAMMCPAPQMCTMTLNTMAHQAVTTSEKALLTLNTSLVSETACTPSYRSTALNYCHIFILIPFAFQHKHLFFYRRRTWFWSSSIGFCYSVSISHKQRAQSAVNVSRLALIPLLLPLV